MFSSVFICVFTLKRMQTLLIYDRSCSLFNILDIFSFGPCEQGVKAIKGTKTFLKTLEKTTPVCNSLSSVKGSVIAVARVEMISREESCENFHFSPTRALHAKGKYPLWTFCMHVFCLFWNAKYWVFLIKHTIFREIYHQRIVFKRQQSGIEKAFDKRLAFDSLYWH
jgi:hypothetical protein